MTDSLISTIHIEEFFALLAIVFFYAALIVIPFRTLFPQTKLYVNAWIRPISLYGALVCSSIHSSIVFFTLLQGFKGISFLSSHYQIALLTGFIPILLLLSYCIYTYATVLLYIAGFIIVFHPIIIGSHFHSENIFSVLYTLALFVLLIAYALFLRRRMVLRYKKIPVYVISLIVIILVAASIYALFLAHSFVHGR